MPNNDVAVGGREESRKLTHTHTRTHSHTHEERGRERGSSRHKEDGGRCGSGGADLHPAAAASLMEAGELAARSGEAPLSASVGGHLRHEHGGAARRSAPYITSCCVVVKGTVHCRRSVLLTVLEGGRVAQENRTARFRGNAIQGFRCTEPTHRLRARRFVPA